MPDPKWPLVLKDAASIADYISDNSKGFVSSEMIEEFFFDSHARLEKRRVDSITPGDSDHNEASANKQARYAKLSPSTRPPIVLDFANQVADGNHRLRDAVERKETFIWCYVPYEGEHDPRQDRELQLPQTPDQRP